MAKTVHDRIADYYSSKLALHGATPRGVDWNGEESQKLRFDQLLKVVSEAPGVFSLVELGCGYGALVQHLAASGRNFTYLGLDLSAPMVEAAKDRYGDRPNVRFEVGSTTAEPLDFAVASGLMNVKMDVDTAEWEENCASIIETLDRISRRGFAFNALTAYSDRQYMRDDLYYMDPLRAFDQCKRNISRNVALLHDYGLYEFTLIVRKD